MNLQTALSEQHEGLSAEEAQEDEEAAAREHGGLFQAPRCTEKTCTENVRYKVDGEAPDCGLRLMVRIVLPHWVRRCGVSIMKE